MIGVESLFLAIVVGAIGYVGAPALIVIKLPFKIGSVTISLTVTTIIELIIFWDMIF